MERVTKKAILLLSIAACGDDDATLEETVDESAAVVPRQRPDKAAHGRLEPGAAVERIVIKFHEGTHIRLRAGGLAAQPQERSAHEQSAIARMGLAELTLREDLSRVNALVGSRARPLFADGEDRLAENKRSGEASGRELADLNLYFELPLDARSHFGEVADLVDSLNALDSVETAYAQPPAVPAQVDIPPVTPSLEVEQGYLDEAPAGIGARYAWTVPGGNGAGVRIVDVEGDWRTTHEDMPPLFHQGGGVFNNLDWRNHGTAVLGVMVGERNAYGVTGIVWGATAGYESIASQSPASAIARAATAAGNGGVVLVELHSQGPAGTACTCNQSQCGFVAMEFWQAEFDAIATASANGVIVVEAAGNGSANLDDARYGGRFNRAVRDSGAILVGAGNGAGRAPTCWTNHGSRIDAFGWGEGVTTMGYGSRFNPGDENQLYTGGFNGTSSASPVVVGAVASVQGVVLGEGRPALTSWQMRDLLFRTGTPQSGGTQHIARMPNLRAAIDAARSPFLNLIHTYPAGWDFSNPSPWEAITGDFNGDGKTDYGRLGGTYAHFFFSNGDGTFSTPIQVYPAGWDFGNPGPWETIVGDFNGDGMTDYGRLGSTYSHFFFSNGDGTFSTPFHIYPASWDFGFNAAWPAIVGDFNGDGMTDYGRLGGTYSHFFFSNGNGTFSAPVHVYPAGWDFGNPGPWETIVGDFNGDGRTDYGRLGGTYSHFFLSNGNGTFSAPVHVYPAGWDFGFNAAWPAIVGDWSGDGSTDFLRLGGTYSHVFIAP